MKKIMFLCTAVIITMTISNTYIFACPKCNQDFRNELLNERANTLGAKELLKAIENQSGTSQLVESPVKYTMDIPESENKPQEVIEENTEKSFVNTFEFIKFLSPLGFFAFSLVSTIN